MTMPMTVINLVSIKFKEEAEAAGAAEATEAAANYLRVNSFSIKKLNKISMTMVITTNPPLNFLLLNGKQFLSISMSLSLVSSH